MTTFNKIKFALVSVSLLFGAHMPYAMDVPQDSNSQCPTSIQFSAKAREIFDERMPVILKEALTLHRKSGTYEEVLCFLAKGRREIAQACADANAMSQEDANRFGKPRLGLAYGRPVSLTTVPYIQVNASFIASIRSLGIENSHSEEFRCTRIPQTDITFFFSHDTSVTMHQYLLANADDNEQPSDSDDRSDSVAFQKFIKLNENRKMSLSDWYDNPHESKLINDYLSKKELVLSHKTRVLKGEVKSVDVGEFYELGANNSKGKFQHFMEGTVILIDHAPLKSIPYLRQKAAEHFNAAKSWDCEKQDQNQLLGSIHSFFFYETLAMYYERGSESITKAGTQFLAGLHGYQIHYPQDFEFRTPFIFSRDLSWYYFMKNVTIIPEIEKL